LVTQGSFATEIEGWSGEAEFGVSVSTRGGVTIDISLGLGGLFADAESYTGRLSVNVPIP
jgi:hypothetical protein